jgi:hypothetical protein
MADDEQDTSGSVPERQSEVLELQARELDESLAERKWEAEQRRIAQASRIFTGAAPFSEDTADVSPRVVNASDLPVYDAQLWHPSTRTPTTMTSARYCQVKLLPAPGATPLAPTRPR